MNEPILPQQTEWSQRLEKEMMHCFPDLRAEIVRHVDESVSMEVRKEYISLWVSSYRSEYTIGLDNISTNTWHHHMSSLGANTIDEQIEELVNTFRSIVQDEVAIIEVEPGHYSAEIGDRNRSKMQKCWGDFV